MPTREEREAMWVKVLALYAAYWPGRATLTAPTILAMEEAGLSRHDCDAVLVAVRIAGKTSEHPPTLAELLNLLEGETRRVPIYVTDLYGAVRLGNDGAPLVKGWKEERSAPVVYEELRRAKGLADSIRPALAYRPPENLDRPEHDGEPRPVLPSDLLKRAAPGASGVDGVQGGTPGDLRARNPTPVRSRFRGRPSDGCWACGYKRNRPGVAVCEHCKRPLSRETC